MASRGKRKVHPQFIAIELILLGAFGIGAYFLAQKLGNGSGVPVFLAGAAFDRALILVLRHRNKRLLPRFQSPVQRPGARRSAGRRA